MYYTEMSGPTGTASTLLQQTGATSKKPADSKAATTPKAGATPEKAQSPAYTISQSMETLLDNLSGKKDAGAAGNSADGAAGGGTGAAASALANGNASSDMAARAKQAQQFMQTALEQAKSGTGLFGKAIDSMKKDLGSVLGSFGVSDDDAKGIIGAFGDHVNDKLKSMDFSQLAVDMQQSKSQWSIESRGMELTIQDGDRSVRISFAKSTLDFRREDQSMQASLAGNGGFSFGMQQATTTATGKATGMIVRADGFSDEEIKGILEKVNGMANKNATDGMNGLGVLKPTTSANGITHLTLDLSTPIKGLNDGNSSASGSAKETTAPATPVNITA